MSKANKSVNRPPTPEPEEPRELTLEESVQLKVRLMPCGSVALLIPNLLCWNTHFLQMPVLLLSECLKFTLNVFLTLHVVAQLEQSGEKERLAAHTLPLPCI